MTIQCSNHHTINPMVFIGSSLKYNEFSDTQEVLMAVYFDALLCHTSVMCCHAVTHVLGSNFDKKMKE